MSDLTHRLAVLADAARHDAPCAARLGGWRGPQGRGRPPRALPLAGSADPVAEAVCHAVAADGRTVALLKILLSNHCVHDCAYCPLRRSADGERARLSVREVVRLTLDYHRRGVVEGLFLSAAVDRDADATMEQMVAVARSLRRDHHFLGYVHLKVIPEASAELVAEAGRWGRVAVPRFAPAGQVTQMVVGATGASDAELLRASQALYLRQRLRRVYFGSFVPPAEAVAGLSTVAPSPLRERRLYQADWLLRHYGFGAEELAPPEAPQLPLDRDPKLAWALRHPEVFPVDLDRASRELLLRVPGFGRRTVERLLAIRPWHRLRLADLERLHVPVARALPFVVLADHRPAAGARERLALPPRRWRAQQLDLFPGDSGLAAPGQPHAA